MNICVIIVLVDPVLMSNLVNEFHHSRQCLGVNDELVTSVYDSINEGVISELMHTHRYSLVFLSACSFLDNSKSKEVVSTSLILCDLNKEAAGPGISSEASLPRSFGV